MQVRVRLAFLSTLAVLALALAGVGSRAAIAAQDDAIATAGFPEICLLYTSPSPRDQRGTRMPSSA